MRIALIAPPWIAIPPAYDEGTESVIFHLVENLIAMGHDVTLLAPGDARTSARQIAFIPQSLIAEGAPWQATLKAYYHLHKSCEYVAHNNFDIVHTHLSSSGDMYLFPLSTMLTTPHVTTLHSHFPFDTGPANWVGDADMHFMNWSPSMRFVAISHNIQQRQHYPINIVGVIHHSVTLPAQLTSPGSDDGYLLWLGPLTREHGAHYAIEAARMAKLRLVLAGPRDRQDRDALHYYQHLIKPYLDNKQIIYLGPVSQSRQKVLLTGAQALLHPSEWEDPSGLLMLRAMAQGCPVIAFEHGVAPELVLHEETGFLVKNSTMMVRAIQHIHMLQRPHIQQHIQQHFSARGMAERYVQLYKKIIASYAQAGQSRTTGPLPSLPVSIEAYNMLTA